MQFYKMYEQNQPDEIQALVKTSAFCRLVTISPEGRPRIGLFNQAVHGEAIVLHLNKRDEQVDDLRRTGRALLEFEDFLALIPSHWVDTENASAATMYYRYAEFDCEVELLETPETMVPWFRRLMEHHQPEGKYAPLEAGAELYQESFGMLVIAIFKVRSQRAKWKVGQNRPPALRRELAARLIARGQAQDARAAKEVLRAMGEA